jgi:DNA-binding PadR family transcriptional regulator
MANLTHQARQWLETAILKDLKVSQTTASSTAGRLTADPNLVTEILRSLVTDELAETDTINGTITVYRITPKGLELLS